MGKCDVAESQPARMTSRGANTLQKDTVGVGLWRDNGRRDNVHFSSFAIVAEDMGKGSSENKLPKDVFAALPKDPDQQLEVTSQITQIAVSGRVAKLEAETSSLRQKVAEKDAVISGLQSRVVGAETTLGETTAKLAVALEGQAKLIEVKNVLTGQVEKLMRHVSKLDDFKKALIKSLESNTECGDDVGDEKKTAASSSGSSFVPSGATPCDSLPASPMSKSTTPPSPIARKQQGQFSCMMPLEPSLKSPSKSVSSNEASIDVGSPRINGKEFFHQIRSRISYEQFSKLLTNIKELNSLRQAQNLNSHQMDVFHPIIYRRNTHVPPNYGDWIHVMPS